MSTPNTQAITPRALRRNRILLFALIVSLAPLAGLAMGLLSTTAAPGPLLLSIDEMRLPISTRAQSVVEPMAAAQPGEVIENNTLVELAELSGSSISPEIEPATDPNQRWFNGRPIRPVRTITMLTTAYSPDARSCGQFADGVTASGYSVWTNGMKLAAADTSMLPFGTMISVPGYDDGSVIPVLDRGGAIKGNRLDLLHPTHEQALEWGAQQLEVTVWEYADGMPNDFVPRYNSASSVRN